ncbi:MAG: ABC transporter substrate-binding protein [Candidatus Paceibacterota bacterium]
MKKTNYFWVVGVVLVVILAIALSTSNKTSKITIGAIIPQTGFGAYWGASVLKGLTMAKDDLIALYGEENVKIVIEDSQSSPTGAVSAANKLLNFDRVNAIYTEFSGPSNAVSPVVRAAGKVLVYSAFNEKILEDNPHSVKTFVSHEVACEDFARKYLDPSKKVIILSMISDAGPYCLKGLEEVVPAENIKDIEGFTGTDFRTLLLQNKAFDADYIIPLMYEDSAYALFKQKGELGITTKIFCYKEDCMTEKNLENIPAEYVRGSLYFSIPIDAAFEERVSARYPGVTEGEMQAIANAYQSAMLLGVGLVECQDRTGECVSRKISEIKDPKYFTYRNGHMIGRMLGSDVVIGEME